MKLYNFNILNKNIHTNSSLKSRRHRYSLESFCKRLNRNNDYKTPWKMPKHQPHIGILRECARNGLGQVAKLHIPATEKARKPAKKPAKKLLLFQITC